MSFLRDEGHIKPVQQSESSTFEGTKAQQPYWEVEFELVMIIDGRNLRYEAHWPPSDDPAARTQKHHVCAEGQISIAAAFKPGTA
jgi:hypothetical protein